MKKTTLLAYVETREDGIAKGYVIRGEGDNAEDIDFEVIDQEPDDVWGPIIGRIADELGYNGSPDYCDGAVITDHRIDVGVALVEITVTEED